MPPKRSIFSGSWSKTQNGDQNRVCKMFSFKKVFFKCRILSALVFRTGPCYTTTHTPDTQTQVPKKGEKFTGCLAFIGISRP